MTNDISWKDKQFQILCDIRDICRANSIRLWLFGDTALAAYRDGTLSDYVQVCIDVKDTSKFIHAIENLQDGRLVCEGMYNNGRYPSFDLRVSDPETIDFNANNFVQYVNNCIHVEVFLIQHVPSSKLASKRLSVEYGLYKDRNKLLQKKASAAKQNKVKMVLIKRMDSKESRVGADAVSDDIFRKLVAGYSGDNGKLMVDKYSFPADMFGDAKQVKIEEQEFDIPKKADKYIRRMFGPNWENEVLREYEETSAKFRDTEFSWEEYKKRVEDIDFDDFQASIKKNNALRREYKVYNDAVHHYYDILRRTDARIKLWQKYEPEKDRIMKMLEDKDYEGLGTELNEYLDALDRFYKLDLGLCFDEEIFEAAKAVLINRGEKEYAEDLEKLIPQVHREPLQIMDYKGRFI